MFTFRSAKTWDYQNPIKKQRQTNADMKYVLIDNIKSVLF